MQISRWIRAAVVSVGLVVAGAITGTTVGVGLLSILGLLDGFGGFPHFWEAYWIAGGFGAVIGGSLGPFLAWALLRDVPLWRVFAATAAGAILWGAIGFLGSGFNPVVALGTATVGVVVSAVRLRTCTRLTPRGTRPIVY